MISQLARITLFPIKSLDGIQVEQAAVLAGGALQNDRRWAIVEGANRFVNGKRTATVHQIRACYDLQQMTVTLSAKPDCQSSTFSLVDDQRVIGEWLSDAIRISCQLFENAGAGFPDDTDASGPTLVGTATLGAVASWFPGVTLDEARRRFRANLEIDGVEPFWEDRLIGPNGTDIPFRIGQVCWLGANPCQRCVVPARDSHSGASTASFQKTFAEKREQLLPPYAERSRFNHFYRLAVNTRLVAPQTGAMLRVGDSIALGF